MVGEFAELQGTIGRYYAVAEGANEEVADAIAEHYSPVGPDDECPSKPVSVTLALADKFDTLAGFFGINEKPTGSRDPFALRRAALGIIRIILENNLRIPLSEIIAHADKEYRDRGGSEVRAADELSSDLLEFFADRLKVHLREKGVRHDLVTAVFALGGEDDLVRLVARAEALQEFLNTEDGENLLAGYRRATNIVKIEEKKDSREYSGSVIDDLLSEEAEKSLHEILDVSSAAATTDIGRENFTGAMGAMSSLRSPVDAFFENVTVNSEDQSQRVNRLNLLSRFRATLSQIADFEKIEG